MKGIGRALLDKLFGKYADDLAVEGVKMPPQDLGDDGYFKSLAGVGISSEQFTQVGFQRRGVTVHAFA